MSGGKFEYYQNRIVNIYESIQKVIDKNGAEKTSEELEDEKSYNLDWYNKYPEDIFHFKYSDEIIKEFKIGVEKLKEAYIYAQRIDWLLSGDDGPESFLERLKEELDENKT